MSYILAFAGFAALIMLHEFGHFIAAKSVGMRVERFALFFPPLILRHKRGETEYAVGAVPLGGYVKISGMNPQEELPEEVKPRAYYEQPVWKRVVVIAAGPAMNVLVAFLILLGLNMFALKKLVPVVGKVLPKTPAVAKLRPGDRIVSVDGKRGGADRLRRQIASHRCSGRLEPGCKAARPARLAIVRDGRRRKVAIRPAYNTSQGLSAMRIGFQYRVVRAGLGPIKATTSSLDRMWLITTRTFSALARIFQEKQRKQISSVVGAYKVTQESFSLDFPVALFLLAFISLSLAIINLFPFLPLDGGHIFFSVAEKVRGRKISFETMQRASVIGFMLVIMLFAIGLSNDIGRLTGDGFNLRR